MGVLVAACTHVFAGTQARAQVAATPAAELTTTAVRGPMAIGPGNALYVGGWWRYATRAEYVLGFDGSGAVDTEWPRVDGVVHAIVPDGAGGWFIGGDFAHVGGQRRARLAHIDGGGALDGSWAPAADGAVRALAVVGATVYVGGAFRSMNGQPRSRLAALDAVSGRLLPWKPRVDGAVGSLAAADGVIYVGGAFDEAGGVSRRGLAAFDAADGALTAWGPHADGGDYDTQVEALVVSGGTLYVAGSFTTVADRQRHGLAAFDTATGALTAWDPKLDRDDLLPLVATLAVTDDTVYVGGIFDRIRIAPRSNLGAVDARTGQALAWRADVGVGGSEVHTLAILDDRLYIGGEFDSVAGQPRKNLAAVSVTTNELLPWDPRPDSTVFALAVNAGRVVVGGAFHGLGSEVHNRLGAIDLGTGTPLPFSARFRGLGRDRISVTTLEVQGDSVFAAGFCGPGNCRRSRYIARFDRQTGRMQRWNVPAGKPGDHDGFAGTYNALAASGRRLYVGGGFQAIGGRPRENLAAVDTRTGRVTRWRADTNGVIGDLLVHGHTLYLIGGFTRVDGHRRKGAAAIDLRSGRVTAWNPSVGLWDPDLGCCFLDAIVVAGQRVYLGGYFDRVGDHRRRYLVAVNRTDGRLERWNPRLNGGVNTLAVIGDTVYAGGRFTSVSGARRKYIAAIDAADGTPTAWNPDADGEVFHLLATPAGLLADGGFDRLGGVNVEHFGLFPRVETAAAHASARSRLDRTALAPD